jgi:hypothetical protein
LRAEALLGEGRGQSVTPSGALTAMNGFIALRWTGMHNPDALYCDCADVRMHVRREIECGIDLAR